MSPDARAIALHRYFDLYSREDIGNTPEITSELDCIEAILKCSKPEQQSNAHFDLPFVGQDSKIAQIAMPSQKLLTNGDGARHGDFNGGG